AEEDVGATRDRLLRQILPPVGSCDLAILTNERGGGGGGGGKSQQSGGGGGGGGAPGNVMVSCFAGYLHHIFFINWSEET
ncbi:hypothetical protein ACJX0J_017368, partial [Zea mays]